MDLSQCEESPGEIHILSHPRKGKTALEPDQRHGVLPKLIHQPLYQIMILCHLSIRNVAAIIYTMLLQLSLSLALPTGEHHQASRIETRDSIQTLHLQAKREPELSVDSSSIPKIAGGAFGIVVLGLIFGLGSASIAVYGSLEWRTRRDKKKQEKGQTDPEKKLDDSSSEKTTIR